MTLLKSTKTSADVQLSFEEVIVINNALNEICHGISLPEFQTRIGVSLKNVENLLGQFHIIINQMKSDGDQNSQ